MRQAAPDGAANIAEGLTTTCQRGQAMAEDDATKSQVPETGLSNRSMAEDPLPSG